MHFDHGQFDTPLSSAKRKKQITTQSHNLNYHDLSLHNREKSPNYFYAIPAIYFGILNSWPGIDSSEVTGWDSNIGTDI
jgi:hypothetical protein